MHPGWYPDPDDETARRYWDGLRWSAPLRTVSSDVTQAAPDVASSGQSHIDLAPTSSTEIGSAAQSLSVMRLPEQTAVWVLRHKGMAATCAIAVLAAVALATYLLAFSSPTMTVAGDVTFGRDSIYSVGPEPDADGTSSCNGDYEDKLTIGDPVTVRVGGQVVATGKLDEGTYDPGTDECTMTFTIRDVPADDNDYDVAVGDGNPVNFTKAEMVDGPSIQHGDGS